MSKQDQFILAHMINQLEPGVIEQHRLFIQALIPNEIDPRADAATLLRLCAAYGKMYQLCKFLGISDPGYLIQEFRDTYGGSQ